MSPLNSRAKGARGETEFIKAFLAPYWPEAKRNLDQFGADKRDCLEIAGVHWQIKRVEKLNINKGMDQARGEANRGDIPIVAHRINRAPWLCTLDAEDFIPLLRLRDAA